MLLAALTYGLAIVAVVQIADWLLPRVAHVPLTAWLAEHVYLPMLRAAAMVAFLLVAYPSLFGIASAPALGTLFTGQGERLVQLVELVWLVALLLPLLPFAGRLTAAVLPLQAMAGAALLFSWLAEALGVTAVSYWPGGEALAGIAAVALAGHVGARLVATVATDDGNLPLPGHLLYEAVVMACQVPAVMIYARALGRQLI
ncbi:MAG TPA: hypothetical protein VNL72_02705 [Gammaproteobacteria bacterium]|nr:hypothetical protein [Gammaproteobacteria bacterium]